MNLLTSFEGITQNGFIPPDVQVATGPNHIVEMVNADYAIWTKQGVFVEGDILENFFLTGTDTPIDPKIIYDTQSGRWFASALVVNLDSARIAVSTTDDPTGTWIVYNIFYQEFLKPSLQAVLL